MSNQLRCRGCGQEIGTGTHKCPGPFALQKPAPPSETPVGDERATEAARTMYDALTEIAESDGFFEGEKRLKGIARRALERVRELSRRK